MIMKGHQRGQIYSFEKTLDHVLSTLDGILSCLCSKEVTIAAFFEYGAAGGQLVKYHVCIHIWQNSRVLTVLTDFETLRLQILHIIYKINDKKGFKSVSYSTGFQILTNSGA